MINWLPIDDDTPKDRPIFIFERNEHGIDSYGVAIWYFGDWGSCTPILGDGFNFKPTHWAEVEPPEGYPVKAREVRELVSGYMVRKRCP